MALWLYEYHHALIAFYTPIPTTYFHNIQQRSCYVINAMTQTKYLQSYPKNSLAPTQ